MACLLRPYNQLTWTSVFVLSSAYVLCLQSLPAPQQIVVVQVGPSALSEKLDTVSDLSMLIAVKYCAIHGYQYRRYVTELDSTIPGGQKPKIWAELLADFELVVALDLSVTIRNVTLSLHEMLGCWGFSSETLSLHAVAAALPENLALGPGGESALLVDTGLIVLRNSHRVIELMREWYRCFGGNRNCIAVRPPLSEQKVWTAFVMPKLLSTERLSLQCNDVYAHTASCKPRKAMEGCPQPFVSHHLALSQNTSVITLQERVWQLYVGVQPELISYYF